MRWLVMMAAVWCVVPCGEVVRGEDLRVSAFGAIGDGTTVDRQAVQAALNAAKAAGGGRVVFEPNGVYHLGNLIAAEQSAIEVASLRNVVIEGNHAELVVNTVNGVSTSIVHLIAPSNVRVQNLRFRDVGTDVTAHWRGAVGVSLVGAESSGDQAQGRVVLDNLHGVSLLALLEVGGDAAARLADIALRDCRADGSYYGVRCRNNGDGLRASGFQCHNVRRPYFVYGVENHEVEVSVTHDGTAPGQDTACLIKCYDRDTRGIKLRARFGGSTAQYVNAVTLEHQRSAGPGGAITGIDLGLEIDSPGPMVPVRFRSYRDTGPATSVEESRTANRWDRIRIGGTLATTAPAAITCGALVSQAAEGRLLLDAGVVMTSRQPHYPGFVVQTGPTREFRTLKGALASQTCVIPLDALATFPFEVIVTTWAQDDTTAVGASRRTVVRELLCLQNASGNGVGVQVKGVAPAGINTAINGAATVSYSATGQNLVVSIAGYNGPQGLARVEIEYISRGP